MAALIPLLLPHIVEAATNIGIGISNAVQGTSSNVTLQIGNKVFTTRKRFNFLDLPYELRQRIILLALGMSKSLILPAQYYADPFHIQPLPTANFKELQKRHPLHPENENYRSIVGERFSANGYPLSSWRWQTVSREWREIVQKVLWAECEVVGYRPYTKLQKLMDAKKGFSALPMIRSITLREGFSEPADLYTMLSHPRLTALEDVSILPDWPTTHHPLVDVITPFPFGLQLVRTQRPLKSLTYGLPLELTTNESSRQQLKTLAAPRVSLTFIRPTLELFHELHELMIETTKTLSIRYLTRNTATVDPRIFLCKDISEFDKVEIHLCLPRTTRLIDGVLGSHPVEDPNSPSLEFITRMISALEAADEDIQEKYTVYNVKGWEALRDFTESTKIWPVREETTEQPALQIMDKTETTSPIEKTGKTSDVAKPGPSESRRSSDKPNWERQTNLKLLGGLIGLSLESKKY